MPVILKNEFFIQTFIHVDSYNIVTIIQDTENVTSTGLVAVIFMTNATLSSISVDCATFIATVNPVHLSNGS
jgi:hypothetical protein